MRREERRLGVGLLGVGAIGVVGAVLLPVALYQFGLWLAPPRPIPQSANAPQVLLDALWARADGGRATALTPVTPVSVAQFAVCMAIEDFRDTTPGDARRAAACREYLPAIQGVAYLSGVHMRDANLQPSFREGLGRFSTTVWLTQSWTKAEFLDTLAERGEFGFGFRGVEAAARGYFGRAAAQLTLPQAALIGAFIGDPGTDPWCGPEAATGMRNRILKAMRENGTIDEPSHRAASAAPLELFPPPGNRPACTK